MMAITKSSEVDRQETALEGESHLPPDNVTDTSFYEVNAGLLLSHADI